MPILPWTCLVLLSLSVRTTLQMPAVSAVPIGTIATDDEEAAKIKALEEHYDKHKRRAAKRDSFPVFNNPKMLSAQEAEAKKVVLPRDLVIGVAHEGAAKAYPIPIMGVHEMGNDMLGDLPIAPSW